MLKNTQFIFKYLDENYSIILENPREYLSQKQTLIKEYIENLCIQENLGYGIFKYGGRVNGDSYYLNKNLQK